MRDYSVGDDFPKQQEKCRELLKIYESLGNAGLFAAMSLKQTIKKADEAIVSGDIVKILSAYKDMQEYKY